MKVLISIPCYNCAPQIKRVLGKLHQLELPPSTEVLLVDNKSEDDTAEVIKSHLKESYTFIQHKTNYGLGGTFKTICQYARENHFDFIVLFHGDDQASTGDLKNLLSSLEHKVDCIFGARFMKGSRLHSYSKRREYGNRMINLIYSLALGQKIYDIGSGLNAYKVSSLPMLEIESFPSHIAFDINLLLHYTDRRNRLTMKFIPIEWYQQDQKSNAQDFKVGFKVLYMLFLHLLGRREKSESAVMREFEIMLKQPPITYVICAAGLGQRFTQHGLTRPKPLLKLRGKTMLERSVECLNLRPHDQLIIISQKAHHLKEHFSFLHCEWVEIDGLTRGQLHTFLFAKDLIRHDDIVIFNCDTSFSSAQLSELIGSGEFDGIIPCFEAEGEAWSFCLTNAQDDVLKVTEKQRISEWASVGYYYFKGRDLLFDLAQKEIASDVAGEVYVAPLYERYLRLGKKIKMARAEMFLPFGTPEQIKEFWALNLEDLFLENT